MKFLFSIQRYSMKKKSSSLLQSSRKYIRQIIFGITAFFSGIASTYIVPELSPKAYANPIFPKSKTSEFTPPCCFTEINRSGYSLSYDHRTKNSVWVYEKLTAENLKGNVDRENYQFKEDPVIEKIFRSTLQDYKGSGFDRGHLAPAANHKCNACEMAETFFLSNMSPQNPQFNRGYWASLEKYVRNLTKKYKTVEVYTGPLFLPKEDSNGKRWVTYQVIGKNDVAVPTHYYKVLFLSNSSSSPIKIEAYVLPNQEISSKTPLSSFQTTLEKVESVSGLIFSLGEQ